MVGSTLLGLGVFRLNEASVIAVKPWKAPSGLLLFGTVAEKAEWGITVGDISFDENKGIINIDATLQGNMSGNVVMAMRIPYIAEIKNLGKIDAYNLGGERISLEAKEKGIVSLEPDCSLAHIKFFVAEDFKAVKVNVLGLRLEWSGFIIREEFSRYTVVIPISYHGSVNDTLYSVLSGNVQSYYGESLVKVVVFLTLPQRVDVTRLYPPTAKETISAGG